MIPSRSLSERTASRGRTRTGLEPTAPRADLESIRPYVPGRHPAEIVREYGVTDVLKLASNENPLGPSPGAMAAIDAAIRERAHLYPDSQAVALRAELAGRLDLSIDHLVVGNGSVECIDLVARAFLRPGDDAVVGFPSFPRFQIACQIVGIEPSAVPHRNWRADLDGMIGAIGERTRVLFLDNPCNPTGTHVGPGELADFLGALPPRVLVVLDRAYQEFVPGERRFGEDLDRIRAGENLIVLRTFSKVHGLAGLRIGYAAARPEHARAMNRVREAFNTSSLAQAAAIGALEDEEHVDATVRLVERNRPWLADELRRLGFDPVESRTNFLFVDLGSRSVTVHEGLLERGIVIRPMSAPGIDTWARISVPTRAGGERLIDALEELAE